MKFLDPEWLISTFGVLGILAIAFAESGLLIGRARARSART